MSKIMGCVATFVASLALSVSAAETVDAANLLHRWSFNGSLADECGGNTARLDGSGARWDDAAHPTGVTLPGGSRGAGAIDLGYDCAPVGGGSFTLEIWARQNAVSNWSRVFDWGQDTSNYTTLSWTRGTTFGQDRATLKYLNTLFFENDETMQPYTLGTLFHISVHFSPRASGGFDMTWMKRDAQTGAVLKSRTFGTDTKFPADKFNQWKLWLGRSFYDADYDAAATYYEARIWKGIVSNNQLNWSARLGPDTLPTAAGNATTSTIGFSVTGSGSISTGNSTVTTTAIGEYPRSSSINLTATPASGWLFRRWTGDMTYLTAGSSTTATITLETVRDANLVAEFVTATEPMTATWTGAAGDGDPTTAANWDCRDANNAALTGALPTAMTAVTVSGNNLNFNCPVGTVFPYATLTIGDCTLAADSDWRGLGAFSINGKVNLDGHTLRVPRLDGTGNVFSPMSAATVPSQLNSAMFRLDASDGASLNLNADGNLANWTSIAGDQRTANASGAYPTPIMTPYGRPAFDFGGTGSNRDMMYTRFTNIRTVFWVMKIAKAEAAFFLGDRNGGSGTYNFHRGSAGQYGNPSHAKFSSVWNGTTAVNWSSDFPPDNDYVVYSATMSQNSCSDSLTYDRNISSRCGGRQLSEVILFNSVLSDADRTAITQYLDQKWKTGDLRAPGTLRIDVPEGESVTSSTLKISGNVKLVKDGAGTFTPSRGNCYFGGTEVAAGTLKPGRTGTQSTLGAQGTAIKLDADGTYDANGINGFTGYKPEFAGGTMVNSGATLDGNGPFGAATFTADSYMNLAHSAGFNGANVDLGGHTLDVTLPTPNQCFCLNLTTAFAIRNGTLRTHGPGMLKIWAEMTAPDLDMDIDSTLWMCWTSTVHNLTFRYQGDDYHVDNGTGAFRVGGTFKPMSKTFVRTYMLDGSTLDLTGETGAWDILSQALSGTGNSRSDHRLMFDPGVTVTIDLHGRTLVKGERILKWSAIPEDVTFQWDAATAALDNTIQPVLKADGLYYGAQTDPAVVTVATWTGAANDGDLTNAANWSCKNGLDEDIVGGLPGAAAEVHLAGNLAVDVTSPFTCARVVVDDATLTADCDWRGISAPIEFNGLLDLKGHTLRTAVNPEGVGEITSTIAVSPGTAPSFVATDACLWLDAADASTLTIDNDGYVTAWQSKGATAVTATAAATKPIWNPRDWGRPCVDFGGASSKRDMTYPRFTTLRTVFWVVRIDKTAKAFLLGDINGGNGTYNFHRGDYGVYGSATHAKFSSVWNGLDPVSNWSGTPIPDDDFQVISVVTSQNCSSDSLTNDRNLNNGDRTGGRQLQEIICFERVLNDTERTQVTQYLQQKWRTAVPTGNFKLDVPAGRYYENRSVKLSGNLAFTKEGEGTFTAACKGQTYVGGNALEGGTATAVLSGQNSSVWSFNNTHNYGAVGNRILVEPGTTFETLGSYDGRKYKFVLNGGTLSNNGCVMNTGWGGFGPMELTADSTFSINYQTTFFQDGTVVDNDLHGHTLTVETHGQNLYPYTVKFGNGTLRLEGNGQYVVTAALSQKTLDLYTDGALNLGAALDVRDYTSAATTRNHSGSAACNVWGVFTPLTDNFYGCTLQNGATLNLSGRTEPFSTTTAFSPSKPTVTFASGATVTVDLHGRTLAAGDQLVAWTTPPLNVTFQWDAATAEGTTEQPQLKPDGLYFGGEPDLTVTEAHWTGAAGDGNIANYANWVCSNATGQVVAEGVPGTAAIVHLKGDVKIDFPAGSACDYRGYDFGNIRLTADCDWRGLDASTWGTIDLNGHKLYVSNLPASGTVASNYTAAESTPPAITANACFWLDASDLSTLTMDANNKVSQWNSKVGSVNAVQGTANNRPTYSDTNTSWKRPTVDFGAAGSGLDMAYTRFSNLRTVFWVIKIQNTEAAFLLGDTGNYNFHRGAAGQYGNAAHHKFASIWNGTTAVNIANDVIPDGDFQVISATMSVNANSDRLTTDRNCKSGNIYRNGGRQLSELICFSSVLSDADRTAVIQYLQDKWFSFRSHGDLVVDVPAGRTVVNNGVLLTKNVRIVKTGAGTYVGNKASQTYTGGNDVQAGTIRPGLTGTNYVFGPWGSEVILRDGAVSEQNGMDEYTVVKFVLDGGTIRNTGADLNDNTALGKVVLTADSTIEPQNSLSVWWDGHYFDLGGHTLTVPIGLGKKFSIGANTTYLKNGTLNITSGGWLRVWHGALDASTVSLRARCAIEIADDAGPVTVKDYEALYGANYNNGTNVIKVLGTFKPAAGAYFRGCQLQNGATLDLTAQTGVFGMQSAFTSGAKEMTFADNATAINVVLGGRALPAGGKIVDWTGRAPTNLENMTFSLDSVSRRMGRRLVKKADGLYVRGGMIIYVR